MSVSPFDMSTRSIAPNLIYKLATVPMPKNILLSKKSGIPKSLQLSEMSRKAIQDHINTLGIDIERFEHNLEDQGELPSLPSHSVQVLLGIMSCTCLQIVHFNFSQALGSIYPIKLIAIYVQNWQSVWVTQTPSTPRTNPRSTRVGYAFISVPVGLIIQLDDGLLFHMK